MDKIARSFDSISTGMIVDECVGCVDGLLFHIIHALSKTGGGETGNMISYYNGDLKCYGINVKRCCDSEHKILYASTTTSEGTNEILA